MSYEHECHHVADGNTSLNHEKNNDDREEKHEKCNEMECVHNRKIKEDHELQCNGSVAHDPICNGDAGNSPTPEPDHKRVHEHYERPPPIPRTQHRSRSTSFLTRARGPTGHSTLGSVDVASNLRFRSIISSSRHSFRGASTCSGTFNNNTRSSVLTEGERALMEQMAEREERRQCALQRAAVEEERRERLLLQSELHKEASTLNRIVHLEELKQQHVKEHQERLLTRMHQAKLRRLALERERLRKLEEIQRRREGRPTHRDPYNGCVSNGGNRGGGIPSGS